MYGNPTFRFTLTHAVHGSQVISEPQGWREAKLKLERHEDYHSLVEYFEGSFTFYGTNGVEDGGLEFIKTVERLYGVDANIDFLAEISFDDGYTFETIFTGLLDLSDIQETKNNKAEIPVIRNDFWAKFINRSETPVDIQSPANLDDEAAQVFDSVDLHLTSQKIPKTSTYEGEVLPLSGDPLTQYDLPTGIAIDVNGATDAFTIYTQVALDLVQDEIDDSFTLPFAVTDDILDIINVVELIDEGGPLHIEVTANPSLQIHGGLLESSGEADPSRIDEIRVTATLFVRKNSDLPQPLDTIIVVRPGPANPTIGFPVSFDYFYDLELVASYDLTTEPEDIITIYIRYIVQFTIDVGADTGSIEWIGPRYVAITSFTSNVSLQLQSTFPNNDAQSFLMHDVAGQIIDRITGTDQAFYSELLGSTQTNYRSYLSDGCLWENALVKGLQLRRYTLSAKPFFQSFKQWWNGANPIFNLGLGYDVVNGEEVIRIEGKEYFFVPTPSVYIDNVYELMREYDKARIYKKIEIGYNKWQSEDISGIDDPQTKRTYATRLQKVGTDIRLHSEFIAASLAIEVTRRQTIEKSKDYKFDDDTFIIAINGDSLSPDRYYPRLMHGFNFVTNLSNPETRYNLSLTPARNLLRWITFLNNGLQSYIGSLYKFTAGEGNYDMTSDMVISTPGCDGDFSGEVLSEKQDIMVTDEYVFIPQEFTAEIDLSWEDYKTIRNNPRNAIGISQTESDHVAFYIKSLEYQPVQGKAVFKMWPVVPFYMSTSDYVPVNMVCTEDCVDAITDGVDALTDELGECITA